jgi:hypothetical protein
MTTTAPVTSKQASVDAALLVLKSMGLSPEDLLAPSNRPPVPTFAEYVPVVSATVTAASLRAYRPYWNRTVVRWGERRLDETTPSEVKQLVAYVKANAVQRRAHLDRFRDEHAIAASDGFPDARCAQLRCEKPGIITGGVHHWQSQGRGHGPLTGDD